MATIYLPDDLSKLPLITLDGPAQRCECEGIFKTYPTNTVKHEEKTYILCDDCKGIISCEGCNAPVDTVNNCGHFCARHMDVGQGAEPDRLTISCTCCTSCRSECIESLTTDPPQ